MSESEYFFNRCGPNSVDDTDGTGPAAVYGDFVTTMLGSICSFLLVFPLAFGSFVWFGVAFLVICLFVCLISFITWLVFGFVGVLVICVIFFCFSSCCLIVSMLSLLFCCCFFDISSRSLSLVSLSLSLSLSPCLDTLM
jgi:hypothetical protein